MRRAAGAETRRVAGRVGQSRGGRLWIRAGLLALVVGLLAGAAAASDPPRFGELILVDREWPTGGDPGGLLALDPHSATVRPILYLEGTSGLTGITWGLGKSLYVGDGSRLWVGDAYDSLDAGARSITHPFFAELVSLATSADGEVFLLDRSADPLGEGYQGALFSVDAAAGRIYLVASDSLFVAPADLVPEEAGTILVMDPQGRVSSGAPGTGALFRVDPETHESEALFSLSFANRATAVALRDPQTLLLLDGQATPPSYPEARGLVYVISLASFTVIDTLEIEALRDPVDLALLTGDRLAVIDRAANPEGYVDAQGLIAVLDLADGELLEVVADPRFRDLRAGCLYTGPDLDASQVTLSGFPEAYVLPGTRGTLIAEVINEGCTAAGDVQLAMTCDSLDCLFGTARALRGAFAFDAAANRISWEGPLGARETLQVTVDVRVPESLSAGGQTVVAIELTGTELALVDTLRHTVVADLEPGTVIFAAPSPVPWLFTLGPTGYQPVEWVSDRYGLLRQPVDLAIAPGGRVYVLDNETDRPKVVAVDPVDRSLSVVYEGEPLDEPSGLCVGHDGALLITDTRGVYPEATPGAVYRLDPQTGELTTFFTSEELAVIADPVDIHPDIGRHYVVADYKSSPEAPRWGGVIELDADGGFVQSMIVGSSMDDPYGLHVDVDGRIYVTDIGEERPGVSRLVRGGVGVVYFTRLVSQPGDTLIIEPLGIVPWEDHDFIICDAQSNLYYPDRGGLLRLYPQGGRWDLSMQSSHYYVGRPRRGARYELPKIAIRQFDMEDLNGGALALSDTLELDLVLENEVPTPGLGVGGVLSCSSVLRVVSAAASRGGVRADLASGMLHWSADLAFGDPESLVVRFQVDSLAFGSETVEVTLQVIGGTAPPTATLRDTLIGPLPPEQILVLDANADPLAAGTQGALYLYNPETITLTPYRSHPDVVRPVDFLPEGEERLLLLASQVDPEGVEPSRPALQRWDLRADTVSAVAVGDPLADPVRLLAHPEGGYWILDEDAHSGVGLGRGSIFYLPPGGGEVELWAQPEAFRRPGDMILLANGELWVADLRANPGGFPVQNSGAFFIFDSQSGALIDTLANEALADPQGLAYIEGEGLYFTDPVWHIGGDTGIRRIDLETREIEVILTSPDFGSPTRMLPLSPNELLAVDSTAQPSGGEGRGALHRIDRLSGELLGSVQHPSVAHLRAIVQVPAPSIGIRRWELSDGQEGGFSPGDTLDCRLVLENTSTLIEPVATAAIDFSGLLVFDPAEASATAGELVATAGALTWQGPLAGGDSAVVNYRLAIGPRSPGEWPWGSERLVLTAVMAEGLEAARHHYVASATGEGEILVADLRADPLEHETSHGAIFRLEGPTRDPVPIIVSEMLRSPVRVAQWPGSETELLIVDADAPGPGSGEGGLFRASTATGLVEALFQDSALVEPTGLALLDSTACYLLDAEADPLDLEPGSQSSGPGAVYQVDLETGSSRLVASDARFETPIDLLIERDTGTLYVIDRDAQPGVANHAGGVFAIDPKSGTVVTRWLGDPFHSVRCGAWGPAGELLVIDQWLSDRLVYELPAESPPEEFASCDYCREPRGMTRGEGNRLLIADGTANPGADPTPTGSVLRLDLDSGDCQIYRSGPPLRRPSGLAVRHEGTAVELVSFAVGEMTGGVEIRWIAPPPLQGSDFYIYRRMPEEPGGEYSLRNPHAPVHGEGELRYLDLEVAPATLYEYMLVAMLPDGTRQETHSITIRTAAGRRVFFLDQPAPNPWPLLSGGAGPTIRFGLPAPVRRARLSIVDVTGRRVRDLLRGPQAAGSQSVHWNGRDERGVPVGSGVYFLRLDADGRRISRRIVLVR